jgi:hypothetical protein
VLYKGRIVASGGPELADQLETTGYAEWVDPADGAGVEAEAVIGVGGEDDPFADPLA